LFGALVVATSFVAAGATGASAGNLVERPFDVEIHSEFMSVPDVDCPSGYLQLITGTGHASHMGQLTLHGESCLGSGQGVVTWVAANGDEITHVYTSVMGDIGPDGSTWIEFYDDDAYGTGRFEQVSLGEGPLAGMVQFFDEFGMTGMLVAEYHGTITYDASDRS
jgi:hypothetical protein